MANSASVYLDACCFIDAAKYKIGSKIYQQLEKDRQKDVWYAQKALEAARAADLEVFTSVISIAECSVVGHFDVRRCFIF